MFMEWSKDKTLKLIELLQLNPSLWNPSIGDTRREKQKRKEELRAIADVLKISVADTTKKIQHLRTQYNRESAREVRANAEEPNDRYVSNWYAFEYLHFMKDSNKPYRILHSEEQQDINDTQQVNSAKIEVECKLSNFSPPHKIPRTECNVLKSEGLYPSSPKANRDEFSVFGEYIANELRSLKGEKNLLVAKKKIQDAIFEVKMGMISESRTEHSYTVFSHNPLTPNASSMQSSKLHPYVAGTMSMAGHIETLSVSQTPPTSQINEIIVNGGCHYSNFKVDSQ